jgi:hypothetical protein
MIMSHMTPVFVVHRTRAVHVARLRSPWRRAPGIPPRSGNQSGGYHARDGHGGHGMGRHWHQGRHIERATWEDAGRPRSRGWVLPCDVAILGENASPTPGPSNLDQNF